VRPVATYDPDPTRSARYDERFAVYRDLYPTLAPLLHRI